MTLEFKRATCDQARLKVGAYGPPGSGKTFTSLLIAEELAKRDGKRIAFINTETGGTAFYAIDVPQRSVHPKAFDFDIINTRSLLDASQAAHSVDPAKYSVIIVDSISHLWDAAMEAYNANRKSNEENGKIPMHAWGGVKKPFLALVRFLIESPDFHVFILGRQKNVFDTATEGEWRKVGVAMKTEGTTEYEPSIVFRMEARKSEKDSARSTYFAIIEKDRTGILAGRTLPNPDFKTFEPILPLLGKLQASTEDGDETAAKDSELLRQDEEKTKAKEDKSREIFNDFNAKIVGSGDLPTLGALAEALKPRRRYLTEDHYMQLLAIYKDRHATLSALIAPKQV